MAKKAVYFTSDGIYIRPSLLIRRAINIIQVIQFIDRVLIVTAPKQKELP